MLRSSTVIATFCLVGSALAQVPIFGQCGGIGFTGSTICVAGSTCQVSNQFFSQCLPASVTSTTTSAAPSSTPSNIAAILNAIATTPLASTNFTGGLGSSTIPPSNGSAQAFVNQGSIQSFNASIPDQSRSDALFWTLFAQLAADAKFNRNTDAANWYNTYVVTLGKIGMSTNNFTFNTQSGSQLGASVNLVTLAQLAAFFSNPELALTQASVDALAGGNPAPLNLFNDASSDGQNGNFQVSTGNVDPGLNLVLTTGFFHLETHQQIIDFLFFQFTDTNYSWSSASDTLTLSKVIADQSRDALIKALGAHIADNIANIPLA